MGMRMIYCLTEEDLYEFLGFFPGSITGISLTLYNGTPSHAKDLPNGATAYFQQISFFAVSIDQMKKDLCHVNHNQIQKCEVHLEKDNERATVTLSLLNRELYLSDNAILVPRENLLNFAKVKELRKVTINV